MEDDAFHVLQLFNQGATFLAEMDRRDVVASWDVSTDKIGISDVYHCPIFVDPASLDPAGDDSRLGKAVEAHFL